MTRIIKYYFSLCLVLACCFNIKAQALSGSFTIGGNNPDFTTINKAVDSLITSGVNGSVVFNIRDGVYTERIAITPINGASAINTITFQSESGDSSKVIIQHPSEPISQSENYIFKLDGVDYVIIKQVCLKTIHEPFAKLITIGSSASHNQILNNQIISIPYPSLSFIALPFNEGAIYGDPGVADTGNVIRNNRIVNGGYGILYKYANTSSNLIIDNNIIENQYIGAIRLTNNAAPTITSNIIRTDSSINNKNLTLFYYSNIELFRCINQPIIMNNKLSSNAAAYGIKIIECNGTLGNEGLIANNFIQIPGMLSEPLSDPWAWNSFVDGEEMIYAGILCDSSSFVNIYHNNITFTATTKDITLATKELLVEDKKIETTSLYLKSSTNINIKNNVFVNDIIRTNPCGNLEIGYAIFLKGTNTGLNSDYNDWFINGSQFANFNGSILKNIESWQQITNQDSNSISANPYYISDNDLEPQSNLLNDVAIQIGGITTDINNQTRNINTDIGAIEFNINTPGAGILSIDTMPLNLCDNGSSNIQALSITLFNNGNTVLTDINLAGVIKAIDGNTSPITSSWSGVLNPGEVIKHSLGNYTFDPAISTYYNIEIWINGINSGIDQFKKDDTINTTLGFALKGDYTIGSTNSNFNNFSDAVQSLNEFGICGSVKFDVLDGSYNEQICLNNIQGTSSVQSITFQSFSKDSTKARLYYNSKTEALNYTIKLRGSAYTTFKQLSIDAIGTEYGGVLSLESSSNNNQFLNNAFTNSVDCNDPSPLEVATEPLKCTIISTKESGNNNAFKNNVITNGSYGIVLNDMSNDPDTGVIIESNILTNQFYTAIKETYQTSPLILKNKISTQSGYISFIGIHAIGSNKQQIVKNRISNISSGSGIKLDKCYNTLTEQDLIANNFIQVGSDFNKAEGIVLDSVSFQKIYHNNIHITTGYQTGGRGLYIIKGSNVSIMNNIFSTSNKGVALNIKDISAINISDYNNLYTNGTALGRWGIQNISDINTWQSTTALETNSLSIDPFYAGKSALYVCNPSLNGAGTYIMEVNDDIDGEIRDTINPDIGADEFSILPISINLGSDFAICTGDSVILDGGLGLAYTWSTGENTRSITVSDSGIYTVLISDGTSCGSDSLNLTVVDTCATGIVQNNLTKFSLSPNPTSNQILLTFKQIKQSKINIVLQNISGQQIFTETLPAFTGNYKKQFNLSNYNKGIYFLSLQSNSGILTKKVVLQ